MTEESQLMCGIILLTVPTIEYGGSFLLGILSGKHDALGLTGFQRAMFRAGHAHAGVIVILSLVAQLLVDGSSLSETMSWVVRSTFPLSALLISGGFFGAAAGKGRTTPGKLIALLYVGAFLLAGSLFLLGVGLLI